ncbi:MAG: phosphoribosyl-ATP pyrophosphohydrolase [Bacilli bacterium]|nr:phosphoribosyl-ATP pyrophosphohydrolase [Bacilli bacterium]
MVIFSDRIPFNGYNGINNVVNILHVLKKEGIALPTYNKLVRDKIPEVIERSGKAYHTRILSDDEYKQELQKKLHEELEEYMNASDDQSAIEELADILELIHAITAIHNSSIQELEQVRLKKAADRGGFKDKVFLINVADA